MRVVAVTYGTEGDVRPLAALCRGLMDAGHEVSLLADGGTLASAQASGVPNRPLSGDIRGTLQPGTGIATVVQQMSPRQVTNALAQIANENAVAWTQETLEAARNSDALIVAGLAAFVGLSLAEHLNIPAIGAGMFPLTPTSAFASPFLPPRRVPRFLNRFSHRLITEALWRAFRKSLNTARARVCGMKPRRKSWTEHPMLYGISPSLLPRPSDWPSNALMCGQWVQPAPNWEPPQSLRDFLAAGDAPLYVGFGSMVGFDRRSLLEKVVQAVAGRRALFYSGWSGEEAPHLPANFFMLGDTPHDWVFPRTAMVIHHGGSGTTHSACRAGVPSIVLPFAADQFFWAEQLRLRGVAPETTAARDVSVDSLWRAIASAESAQMRQQASSLGEQMRAENGVKVAVEVIQNLSRARSEVSSKE